MTKTQTGARWWVDPSKLNFNIQAAGFTSPLTNTTFSGTITNTRLDDLVAHGVEAVRIAIDPSGFLASTTTTTEDEQIAYHRDAVSRCLARGLKVMVSLHFNTNNGTWNPTAIAADYPNGTKYLRTLSYIKKVALAMNCFPADRVCVLLWNEVDTGAITDANWNASMRQLCRVFKANNRRVQIAVSGDQFSTPEGISALVFDGFPNNTMFCFVSYDPYLIFTHQGVTTDPVLSAYNRLSFPVVSSEKAGLFTTIEASSVTETTATVTLSTGSPETISYTSHGMSVNDPFYLTGGTLTNTGYTAGELYLVNTVVDANTITGKTYYGTAVNGSAGSSPTVTIHKGNKALAKKYICDYCLIPYGYSTMDSRFSVVSSWKSSQRVPDRRIILTETGSHGDFAANGASESSRAVHKSYTHNKSSSAGYPNFSWHYDGNSVFSDSDASYVLNERFVVAHNLTASTSYETEASTLFSQFVTDGNAQSTRNKAITNATIKMLKDAGLWTKLGFLYMMRAENQGQGVTNWISPAGTKLTAVDGSLNWVTAAVGNGKVPSLGGTDRYSFSYNSGTAPLSQNSTAMGVKRLTATSGSSGIDLTTATFGDCACDAGVANQVSWQGSSTTTFSSTDPTGTLVNHVYSYPQVRANSRTASGSFKSYFNGSLIETVTQTSSAPSGSTFVLCDFNSPKPNGQFAYAWVSSGLTDAEVALMYVILEFYEQTFGT